MVGYCELKKCRRKQLLNYFGENFGQDNCEGCDICLKTESRFNAAEVSQKILQSINQTSGRFGKSHIINILLGRNLKKIRELGHNKLASYGSVTDYTKDALNQILANLLNQNFIKR